MSKHCCKVMDNSIEDKHIVFYLPTVRVYSTELKDKSASQRLNYCPWCGTKLPANLDDEWFDVLEKLGFDDPRRQDIPPEFKDDRWWKSGKYGKF